MPLKKKILKKRKVKKILPSKRSPSSRKSKSFPGKRKSDDSFLESAKLISKRRCSDKPPIKQKIPERDVGGVQRLLSPFSKIGNNLLKSYQPMKKMNYQSPHRCCGLSPKEKCYVICSCQTRSSRYAYLKDLALRAMKNNKIFSVYGTSSNAVRRALLERGWVEKIPPNRMNLSKIRNGTFSSKTDIHGELERLLLSNMVEKCSPNFIWHSSSDFYSPPTAIDMSRDCKAIVNKLKLDAEWTTKQGLCYSVKRNYWFYIENVAEVNAPRSYCSYEAGEIDDFVKDYKITACTSLLKWVLSMVANDRPVVSEEGKISMNVIVFALNRCKEYLFRKQNKDIDKAVNTASAGQWYAFLRKYYRIIARNDVFAPDKENKLPLYLSYAKFLLKEIHTFRPQLSCEGCHNIWIIKPAHNSRGRGIRMASKLGVITNLLDKNSSKYVIQKYIEEPLLIHETKFDIRQYYIVTSTYPLVIWMYKDCYLKFSSQKYNLKNYHESIHLTNNAVQKKYKNCLNRHAELPQNNMWDLEKYKDYLNRIGKENVWDNIIYPGMRKSIIGIMLSCQDSLSVCKNRFELYGCDFILDKEYKPWLIEINSCPDLNHTTQVTAKICPAVIADIIKVVIDRKANSKASTGKFECIYRQPVTTPRYGVGTDLSVRGFMLPLCYFYKGNIELKESFEDTVDIGKVRDIKAVLQKLKQKHDAESYDIMVQPEPSDNEFNKKKEQETCTHTTRSEIEIDVAATVITKQLNELLDRITSEHSFSSKSKQGLFTPQSSQTKSAVIEKVKSVTDIKSLLKKSLSRFASAEIICTNKSTFNFSKLDDGPQGKASSIQQNQYDYKLSPSSSRNHGLPKLVKVPGDDPIIKSGIETGCSPAYIEATNRMIKFFNEREKEYMESL